MNVLSPLRAERFDDFVARSVAGYAAENVAAGRWPAATALARARNEFELLLPHGLRTPDHLLFEILATDAGPTVGYLWFAVEDRQGQRQGFVYDLEVLPAFRRQGHARRAFQALEALAASLGLSGIGLHVFSHNAAAQALYRGLGYSVTSLNMVKPIGLAPRPDPPLESP